MAATLPHSRRKPPCRLREVGHLQHGPMTLRNVNASHAHDRDKHAIPQLLPEHRDRPNRSQFRFGNLLRPDDRENDAIIESND
ncbi:hypothetical protein Pan216_03910 [Planctomycetes bacterium Pan216]|uniref:Uncharacterized protein n=1 Tax=Kolteria novifilia TaxID=2527975 RepID=A0A518AXW7_9BACT|nr:hypothetical protein Pan216_03910 [Planctomycetes bacterium Pan216]